MASKQWSYGVTDKSFSAQFTATRGFSTTNLDKYFSKNNSFNERNLTILEEFSKEFDFQIFIQFAKLNASDFDKSRFNSINRQNLHESSVFRSSDFIFETIAILW